MKKIFIVLSIIVLNFNLCAQWFWQNPLPFSNEIKKMFFINGDLGWFVSDFGLLFKSIDGGYNWERVDLEVNNNLNSIYFTDLENGFIVGDDGLLLKTLDSGESWNTINLSTSFDLKNIYFKNNIGWITGQSGIFYRSTDNGLTWFYQNSNYEYTINDINFINDSIGIAVCGPGDWWSDIIRTTNGGDSWSIINSYSAKFQRIYSISNIFWLAGWGSIYKSTDFGNTWSKKIVSEAISDFYFFDSTKGYAVGNNQGEVFLTTNSGSSWVKKITGINKKFNSVYFKDNNNGIISGDNGIVMHTHDGGNYWKYLDKNLRMNINSICNVNEFKLVAVGDSGSIYYSLDRGINWEKGSNITDRNFVDVFFINDEIGWAGGQFGKLIKTTDGGSSWFPLNTNTTAWINSVCFLDANNGFLGLSNGSLKFSSDGGISWQTSQLSTNPLRINGIKFFNSQIGLLVTTGWGSSNSNTFEIFKTIDGGMNWTRKFFYDPLEGAAGFHSLTVLQNGYGWAVGERGTIAKTTNYGENWKFEEYGEVIFNSVLFKDTSVGVIVSNKGEILETTNGGIDWYVEKITDLSLLDITAEWKENNIWICGNKGLIINSLNPGVTSVKHIIERNAFEFSLKNNYPNPTNSSTIIEYYLPYSDNVSISIFNILGEYITTLVSEYQNSGLHKVMFDSKNLPSGVYIYSLLTTNISENKKMVILK